MADNNNKQELFEVLKTNPNLSEQDEQNESDTSSSEVDDQQTIQMQNQEQQQKPSGSVKQTSPVNQQDSSAQNSLSKTYVFILVAAGIVGIFGAYKYGYSRGKQAAMNSSQTTALSERSQPRADHDSSQNNDSSQKKSGFFVAKEQSEQNEETTKQQAPTNQSDESSESDLPGFVARDQNQIEKTNTTANKLWYYTIYLMYWEKDESEANLKSFLSNHREKLKPDIPNVAICRLRINGEIRNALCAGRWKTSEQAQKGLKNLKNKLQNIPDTDRYHPAIAKVSLEEAKKIPNN